MSFQAYWFNPSAKILAAEGAGVRIPRMSTTERLALSLGPSDAGTMVFDLGDQTLRVWNGTGWSSGGAPSMAQTLIMWASGGSYTLTSATYNANAVMTSATVSWPDGSSGTYTATTINPVFNVADSWSITHSITGLTVTQSLVTRDANGNITAQPNLTVA